MPAATSPASAAVAESLSREVQSFLQLLPVLATQLEEVSRQIEESVVAVCENFQAMSQKAQEAVAANRLLGAAESGPGGKADGGVESLIAGTRTTLGNLLQRIEQSNRFSRLTAERMQSVEEQIGSVQETLQSIDQVAASARLLALNGQIEAARAGAHGVTFAIVAQETASMAEHAGESSRTIRKLIETAATNINEASQNLQRQATTDSRDVVASRAEVNQMLDSMTTLNVEMQRALTSTRVNSESLANDISRSVMTLQFQDTVGQRIAHVVHSLRELHAAYQRQQADVAEPESNSRGRPASAAHFAQDLSRMYTMESERRVLAQCLQQSVVPTNADDSNVELF